MDFIAAGRKEGRVGRKKIVHYFFFLAGLVYMCTGVQKEEWNSFD